MQRAFSLAGRSSSTRQVKIQPLESKRKGRVTQAPQRQLLAAPPNWHRPPAVWGSEPPAYAACGEGSGMKRRGKAGGSPSPCLRGRQPGVVAQERLPPAASQWEGSRGAESRTHDGPTPWPTLPNQPGVPTAPGSQHGISS